MLFLGLIPPVYLGIVLWVVFQGNLSYSVIVPWVITWVVPGSIV